MPIKFRCPHCQQFLGISRSRAGAVTDCPTCGRTIRVPLLDGTVPPLPEPELNLGDNGLASALEKLAGLAQGTPAASSAAAVVTPAVRESADELAPAPVPLPEPIVIQPAPAPVVVAPPPPAPPAQSDAGSTRPTRPADVDVLESLAAVGTVRKEASGHNVVTAGLQRRGLGALAGGAALLAAIAFAVGYGIGLRSAGTAVPSTADHAPAAPAAPPPAQAAAPLPPGEPALTGRVSYVAMGGETRPDAGARVLVLPEERQGSAKLPGEGLRPGASEIDLRVAQAAVRALGGDYSIADADGHYEIRLPQAGLYQVLILSRYQSREERGLPPTAQAFLSTYFERPAQVLGETAVHLSQFRYRGSGTSPRDQTFELP